MVFAPVSKNEKKKKKTLDFPYLVHEMVVSKFLLVRSMSFT